MKRVFSFILLLGLCFTLVGCTTNSDNENVDEKPIPISHELIEKLSLTKSIIVKKIIVENSIETFNTIKTIDNENQIKEIINLISNSTEVVGDVNYIGKGYELEMYDKDNKLIDIIGTYDTNISIESTKNRYNLDVNALMEIIEN